VLHFIILVNSHVAASALYRVVKKVGLFDLKHSIFVPTITTVYTLQKLWEVICSSVL